MYIDSHCHLNLEQFRGDYRAVIDRAFANNVKNIINVGADIKSSARAVLIADEFKKGIYATVGIHPHEVQPEQSRGAAEENFNESEFMKLADNGKVVAIGEMGLDYFNSNVDKQAQIELMDKQIKAAIKLVKPVIFHCRDAYDDLISHLMSLPQIPKGVLHCFVGNWSHAQMFLDMGFYLSFTGIITFTKNSDQLKVVENMPLDKILIETDAPWLAPEMHRGERNEPSYVVEIAKKIAEIKKISLEDVQNQTTENAINLFNLNK